MLKRLETTLAAAGRNIWAMRRVIAGLGMTGVGWHLGWIDPETAKGIAVGVYTAWMTLR